MEEFFGEWAEPIFYSGLLGIGQDYSGSVRIAAEHENGRRGSASPTRKYWALLAASPIGSWRLISRHGAGAGWGNRGVLIKRSSGRQDPIFIGVLPVRSAVRHPSGRRQVSRARQLL